VVYTDVCAGEKQSQGTKSELAAMLICFSYKQRPTVAELIMRSDKSFIALHCTHKYHKYVTSIL